MEKILIKGTKALSGGQVIDADIAIFPQSAYNAKAGNTGKYNSVMKYASEEYFAHKYTYKFTVENGKLTAEALPRYDQR